jgi:hypothetical protein
MKTVYACGSCGECADAERVGEAMSWGERVAQPEFKRAVAEKRAAMAERDCGCCDEYDTHACGAPVAPEDLRLQLAEALAALEKAAQLVQDWPGIPDQWAMAAAIRALAKGTP